MIKETIDLAYRNARRIVVAIIGGAVLLVGVALLVLPGPAIVVIPVGLAILGLEFAWARRWLRKIKQTGLDFAPWARKWWKRIRESFATRSLEPLRRSDDSG